MSELSAYDAELARIQQARRDALYLGSPTAAAKTANRADALADVARRAFGNTEDARPYVAEALRCRWSYAQVAGPNPGKGGPGQKKNDATSFFDGLDAKQRERWRRLHPLPELQLEELLTEPSKEHELPTFDALLRAASDIHLGQKRERIQDVAARRAAMPTATYAVIYADPPWQHDLVYNPHKAVPYPTMTVEEICAFPVPAGPDAVLFCWATAPLLREALTVIDAWGFDYRTHLVWVKNGIGQGYYFRGKHELLLLARRGEVPIPTTGARPPSVLEAKRGRHSEKPQAVYALIESMFPDLPRIELWARKPHPGWAAFGNEIEAPE